MPAACDTRCPARDTPAACCCRTARTPCVRSDSPRRASNRIGGRMGRAPRCSRRAAPAANLRAVIDPSRPALRHVRSRARVIARCPAGGRRAARRRRPATTATGGRRGAFRGNTRHAPDVFPRSPSIIESPGAPLCRYVQARWLGRLATAAVPHRRRASQNSTRRPPAAPCETGPVRFGSP